VKLTLLFQSFTIKVAESWCPRAGACADNRAESHPVGIGVRRERRLIPHLRCCADTHGRFTRGREEPARALYGATKLVQMPSRGRAPAQPRLWIARRAGKRSRFAISPSQYLRARGTPQPIPRSRRPTDGHIRAACGHVRLYNTLQCGELQTGLAGRSMDRAVFRYLNRCSGDEMGQSIRVGRKCSDQSRVAHLKLGAR